MQTTATLPTPDSLRLERLEASKKKDRQVQGVLLYEAVDILARAVRARNWDAAIKEEEEEEALFIEVGWFSLWQEAVKAAGSVLVGPTPYSFFPRSLKMGARSPRFLPTPETALAHFRSVFNRFDVTAVTVRGHADKDDEDGVRIAWGS